MLDLRDMNVFVRVCVSSLIREACVQAVRLRCGACLWGWVCVCVCLYPCGSWTAKAAFLSKPSFDLSDFSVRET